MKGLSKAEKKLREAIRINLDSAEAHYNLGDFLSDLGRNDEAEKKYQEAIRINPDFAEAHYNLGILLFDTNRNEEARQHIEKAIELFEAQGKHEDAARACEFLEKIPEE